MGPTKKSLGPRHVLISTLESSHPKTHTSDTKKHLKKIDKRTPTTTTSSSSINNYNYNYNYNKELKKMEEERVLKS